MSTITLPFRPLKLVRPPEPPKVAPRLPTSSEDASREGAGEDRVILRDRLLKLIVEREAQRRAPPKPA